MSDILQFEALFKLMGVEHEIVQRMENYGMKKYGVSCISVSQAHFWFDVDGKYLGVEDDEIGYFHTRISS